jgi:hypothetical protein
VDVFSSSRLLIAVDPGVVTGLAWWDMIPSHTPQALELVEDKAMDWLEERLRSSNGPRYTGVVCENFLPRGGAITWEPASLHQIGHAKHLCRKMRIPFRLQTPAQGKRFGTNEKLKALGWYAAAMAAYDNSKTSHPQAIDAMRHLALCASVCGLLNMEEFL